MTSFNLNAGTTRRLTTRCALVASVACAAVALGAPAASAAPVKPARSTATLQHALDQVVAAGVPGAVVLARDGGRTTVLTSGVSDVKRKTKVRATDRFRIGSVTKSMTATVVLALVDDGKLRLDDTVEQRLPGAVPNGKSITVRQLLSMTSGLFDYLNDGDTTVEKRLFAGELTYRWKPAELVGISKRHPARFAPGTGWSYCSTCYILLGQIVERTTGHTLAAELRRRVFTPAGMTATSLDSEPLIAGAHAHGYERLGKGLTDVSVLSPSEGWAAGGIVSNAQDVARFYRALAQGKREPRARAGHAGQGAVRGLRHEDVGLRPGAVHEADVVRHGRRAPRLDPGYLADAWNSPDGNRQVVLLINIGEHSRSGAATSAVQHLVETAYCAS